ncbi:MAG: hypothetical protein QOE45_330 [Frankiaceae bacterium]|jgi:DUF4097 and DUF4098 domain-containing protein YvlB|nr:hypothetical protein [Frankiaceae bacterium]
MQTFDTPGPVLVTVHCPVGEVRADTHDGPTARVDVVALKNDDATRDAAAETTVELRRDGRELVIEVPKRQGSFFGREARIRIDVTVPHESSLAFATASADVTATGRFAEVRGKTASGDVTVAEAAEVRVETASGDLRIGDVRGEAAVKSASGDVTLGRVGGAMSASTVSGDLNVGAAERGGSASAVSGDIDLGAVREGDVDVRTVSGDVTIGINEGSRLHVDVTTVSGDLRSDVALDDSPTGAGEGPLVDIRGRTVSGDLRVRRAANGVSRK